MRWDNSTLGHEAKAELLFGRPVGVALGGRAFDVVEPTEDWQLADNEVGFGSALLHRDFRDYFGRHGGQIYARLQAGREADLTVGFSDEQWGQRIARDPWSLTRGRDPWRANPTMDPGHVHVVSTRLRVDTRDRERSAMSGLYVALELEQGAGRLTRYGSPIYTVADFATLAPEPVSYSRGFVDLRRYNRIAPGMSLDLRVVAGGWLAGDPLPTQRRLAVGGPGTLPGYAFRQADLTPDVLVCSSGVVQAGTPAQCDRVAVAQVQLRSGFLFDAWRDDTDDHWWRPGFNHRTAWVLFADAGRGWMVDRGLSPESGALVYGRSALPPFSTFKVDLGAGVDLGEFGLYWAKAVRDAKEPVRFVLRLEHRF
jgi:hypothetical protein